jgi:hypothetical protein
MVALCILALLSTYVITAAQNIRHIDEMIRRVIATSEMQGAQNHLQQVLSGAMPLVSGEQEKIAFSGEKSRLELIVASDTALELGGLHAVAVGTRARGDGRFDLVEHRRMFRQTSAAAEEGEVFVLSEAIAGLEFRYYGQASPREPPRWHASWVGMNELPRLIEVVVTMPASSRRNWPRQVINLASAR